MKKLLTFIVIIISACLLAGIYGIVHDQFTYTISPEYYTKFKFYQFGLKDGGDEAIFTNPRQMVSIVGFLATWWVGAPIGIILGLVGFIHEDWKQMARYVTQAFLITMFTAFLTGLSGLVYGLFVLADQPRASFTHWYIPDNVVHFSNYIAVGSMHNMSYAGGMVGMVFGGACIVWKRMQLRRARKFKILWTKEKEA